MKKFVTVVLALATLVAAPAAVYAGNALQKAQKKEYKKKMKEFKKGGWELYGSSRSLDVMLLTHYEGLSKDNVSEVTGAASRVSSKSVGHQVTINDACRTYAQAAGSSVKGRVVSDIAADGENTAAEFDHFYAAYERLVEAEIKGELKESFTICRKIDKDEAGKPVYEMQTFFLVDVDAATQARIRAFENAAKESAAAQKYAEKVSQFVREGFKTE